MSVRKGNFSHQLSPEWRSAHEKLLENVRQQPFVSRYECSAHAILDGRKVYLPAYIPYIGRSYFEYRPRILCYAINQNLSPHVPWTKEWVACWATDVEYAQDRLNRAVHENRPIPIRPYAEGFIPLVALSAISQWIQIHRGSLPQTVDDVVAVTNFVKFSTAKDASSSSIPNIWWRECGSLYVDHEIRILRPDIILGFGQKTLVELRRVLKSSGMYRYEPKLLGCRFPARMASIKSKPLSREESKIWNTKILPLIDRMREPRGSSYHKWRIQLFPRYFINVNASWDCAI
ncbi:MAG: hypothetical protein ABIL62_18560 [Planctomycetota bacterium]